jgi:acyl carrier protein
MDIFSKVRGIVVEALGIDEEQVTEETSLGGDVFSAVEGEFDIKIPDDDKKHIATVGELVNFIKENAA